MGTILIIILLTIVFGGGGGHNAHGAMGLPAQRRLGSF